MTNLYKIIFIGALLFTLTGLAACAPPSGLPEGPTPIPTLIPATEIPSAVEPTTMLYTATLTGLVTSTVALPFFWQMPSLEQFGLLLAAACLGAMAHFLLIKAYQMAPASIVAPFSYSELIWASAIGFAVFGDVPTATTLIGGTVLAASGLYLLRRQYT